MPRVFKFGMYFYLMDLHNKESLSRDLRLDPQKKASTLQESLVKPSKLNTFTNNNFRLFQMEIADDNFNFNENGRKFSKRIENAVGEGKKFSKVFKRFLL